MVAPANHSHGATESQQIQPTQENSGRALTGGRIDNVKHAILCDGSGASSQNSERHWNPLKLFVSTGLWEFPLESSKRIVVGGRLAKAPQEFICGPLNVRRTSHRREPSASHADAAETHSADRLLQSAAIFVAIVIWLIGLACRYVLSGSKRAGRSSN
jgi:hypothetical protein